MPDETFSDLAPLQHVLKAGANAHGMAALFAPLNPTEEQRAKWRPILSRWSAPVTYSQAEAWLEQMIEADVTGWTPPGGYIALVASELEFIGAPIGAVAIACRDTALSLDRRSGPPCPGEIVERTQARWGEFSALCHVLDAAPADLDAFE